ncbi:MAG: zf-HC2 domain-containing protein [Acidobacteria bacterium]|jgi:predicted anti-sigma-YlaC factor YlaD|nr:zf-HC2 domain-containing protein [Acidobacteriota bacterium]
MPGCTEIRDLFSLYLEGDLEQKQVQAVREHVAECEDCAGILETMQGIVEVGSSLGNLEPPDQLMSDLASSPCTRWLGLLFQAIDREISQHNLERLLTHLEACPSCRRTWQDMTLVHQVCGAIEPSQYLLKRCIAAREKPAEVRPILNRRMATAAAYLLAVLTSLIIGNPVTLARSGAGEAVSRVADAVGTEVNSVAETGRGEARIILWRAWKWGERKVEALRGFLDRDDAPEETTNESPDDGRGDIS